MAPLEGAVSLARNSPGRLHFIAVPAWQDTSLDDWRRRIDAFYNLGSRIIRFHMAPSSMGLRKIRLDSPSWPHLRHGRSRHDHHAHVSDPDTWYARESSDAADWHPPDHYKMWEDVMSEYPDHPWLAAHMRQMPT